MCLNMICSCSCINMFIGPRTTFLSTLGPLNKSLGLGIGSIYFIERNCGAKCVQMHFCSLAYCVSDDFILRCYPYATLVFQHKRPFLEIMSHLFMCAISIKINTFVGMNSEISFSGWENIPS